MLKIFEKKVRTSLPAVYRSRENGALVLFLKPNYGICLNLVYIYSFLEPDLNCVTDAGWERVKVRIEHLPPCKGYKFPNVLRSKKDGKTVLFLDDRIAFVLDLEGCGSRCVIKTGWDYVDCINSGDWDLVDLTFK